MSYNKYTWQTGETITAEKMNHIEDGIAEGSGGCDCGFECTETLVQVLNDSLTTASMGSFSGVQFAPSQPIEGDSIIVTLNGTDYTLPKSTVSFGYIYGEADSGGNPVFTDYPCAVGVMSGQHYFFTPSEGTYQVVMKMVSATADNITPCFASAVKTVVESSSVDLPFVAKFSDNGTAITPITSYLDVQAALRQGRAILGELYGNSATTGWLSVQQERYGMPVYVFGFLRDTSTYGAGISVEYIAVRLTPDNTVSSETKTLAFAN